LTLRPNPDKAIGLMTRLRLAVAVCALLLGPVAGCGTSGTNPVEFPEARYRILPLGPTRFRVDSLIGGGLTHPSLGGQEFTAFSEFTIVLENAAPPYSGSFTRTGNGEMTVILSSTGASDVSDTTFGGAHPQAVVVNGAPAQSVLDATAPNPEIRFDVCSPSTNFQTCFTPGESGVFGVGFSGVLGDASTTHLLQPACTSTGSVPCSHLLPPRCPRQHQCRLQRPGPQPARPDVRRRRVTPKQVRHRRPDLQGRSLIAPAFLSTRGIFFSGALPRQPA